MYDRNKHPLFPIKKDLLEAVKKQDSSPFIEFLIEKMQGEEREDKSISSYASQANPRIPASHLDLS